MRCRLGTTSSKPPWQGLQQQRHEVPASCACTAVQCSASLRQLCLYCMLLLLSMLYVPKACH
jgi:hypothetical protein